MITVFEVITRRVMTPAAATTTATATATNDPALLQVLLHRVG